MQKLLIQAGKNKNPTYIKYCICSFPSALPDTVEQYFKDKDIILQGMTLAMQYYHIDMVIQ